ncbi:S1C family serine protease [Deinococcus taeanensis]|uniref:S1C family serine protease n=1 Tax=Deinococcus taeanensis TaxID=2737050 RepID=UPI001CDD4FC2|nr:S1C family serine protease [Deinococcus taeanensis]UBV42831.1 S1C family serine protease [Deinococcus taeanensis]
MRASPWLPVLLLLALAAYLLPDLRLPQPRVTVTPEPQPQVQRPALPNDLPAATRTLFEKARPATVRVETVNTERNTGGIGTGFFISAGGQVLTAYHVVSGGQLFQVSTLSGRTYPAQVVAFDASADVALLQVRARSSFPHLNLTSRAPRVGETVLAIGNSGGDFLQPRRGQLLRLNAEAGRADFPQGTLEMNAPLAPGDSGGPIIDGNGQAIGVISYISLDGSGQKRRSYAVPVVEGNDLLAALRSGQKRDVPVVGLIFDAIHSDQTNPPGAIVSEVARRSPAERAGLRGSTFDETGALSGLGDVILRVNGERTRNADEVITAIRRAKIGDSVTLTYLRGGQERQAKITLVPRASVPDLQE